MKELYHHGKEVIRHSGIENPELEASLLLSRALGIKAKDIYLHPEKEVSPEESQQFYQLLERRAKREPIAYILGEKEFYSRTFKVTPDVLIPRPETEMLLEQAIKILEEFASPTIMDIGTGSGCIAVTLGLECPSARIFAADLSFKALIIARENANRHGLSRRISFVCSDLLSSFKSGLLDLIVSNPPYVEDGIFYNLSADVKDYEPKLSLLGGKDGLDHIRKIIAVSSLTLRKGGWCILEIGHRQTERALDIMQKAGFSDISFAKDLSGTERVIKGKWTR